MSAVRPTNLQSYSKELKNNKKESDQGKLEPGSTDKLVNLPLYNKFTNPGTDETKVAVIIIPHQRNNPAIINNTVQRSGTKLIITRQFTKHQTEV